MWMFQYQQLARTPSLGSVAWPLSASPFLEAEPFALPDAVSHVPPPSVAAAVDILHFSENDLLEFEPPELLLPSVNVPAASVAAVVQSVPFSDNAAPVFLTPEVLPPATAGPPPYPVLHYAKFDPIKDCYISATSPDSNFDDGEIRFGRFGATNRWRTVAHFDVSSYPAGTVVFGAQFHGETLGSANTAVGLPGLVTRLLVELWVETEVTWKRASNVLDWVDGGDFTLENAMEFIVPGGSNTPFSIEIGGLVQDAISNRSGQLHILFKLFDDTSPGPDEQFRFYDSEQPTVSRRPYLAVQTIGEGRVPCSESPFLHELPALLLGSSDWPIPASVAPVTPLSWMGATAPIWPVIEADPAMLGTGTFNLFTPSMGWCGSVQPLPAEHVSIDLTPACSAVPPTSPSPVFTSQAADLVWIAPEPIVESSLWPAPIPVVVVPFISWLSPSENPVLPPIDPLYDSSVNTQEDGIGWAFIGPKRRAHSTINWIAEYNLWAISGVYRLRFWDHTAASPIAATEVSTAAATQTRMESAEFTAVEDHVYQAQESGAGSMNEAIWVAPA